MTRTLEESMGFKFRRPELLRAALTHKSCSAGPALRPSNERLEFLGDGILSAVVAHGLYERHPDEDEGALSKRKAVLVSGASLAQWAKSLDLGRHLYLGPGEDVSGGRLRPSILANALEALIGAVYLDGGYDAAREFIRRGLPAEAGEPSLTDYKSRLQEILQKRHKTPPRYEVTGTAGPEHDKTFLVAVRMGKEPLGKGSGKSKKEAEQSAAKDAMERLGRK